MKTFGKNLLPEIHINPINRDLVLIISTGLLAALSLVTAGVMVFSQF